MRILMVLEAQRDRQLNHNIGDTIYELVKRENRSPRITQLQITVLACLLLDRLSILKTTLDSLNSDPYYILISSKNRKAN